MTEPKPCLPGCQPPYHSMMCDNEGYPAPKAEAPPAPVIFPCNVCGQEMGRHIGAYRACPAPPANVSEPYEEAFKILEPALRLSCEDPACGRLRNHKGAHRLKAANVSEIELDSPNFRPAAMDALAARGFKRENRTNASEPTQPKSEPPIDFDAAGKYFGEIGANWNALSAVHREWLAKEPHWNFARACLALAAERDALAAQLREREEEIDHLKDMVVKAPWVALALEAERDALRAEVERLRDLIAAITCDEANAKACERYCAHGYGPLHAEARRIRDSRKEAGK